jgi:hypothetical protein
MPLAAQAKSFLHVPVFDGSFSSPHHALIINSD